MKVYDYTVREANLKARMLIGANNQEEADLLSALELLQQGENDETIVLPWEFRRTLDDITYNGSGPKRILLEIAYL